MPDEWFLVHAQGESRRQVAAVVLGWRLWIGVAVGSERQTDNAAATAVQNLSINSEFLSDRNALTALDMPRGPPDPSAAALSVQLRRHGRVLLIVPPPPASAAWRTRVPLSGMVDERCRVAPASAERIKSGVDCAACCSA